jgi:hypothetical protein
MKTSKSIKMIIAYLLFPFQIRRLLSFFKDYILRLDSLTDSNMV